MPRSTMPMDDGLPGGTLRVPVLRLLAQGPLSGHAIARRIHALSRAELSVEAGSHEPRPARHTLGSSRKCP